MRRRGMVLGGLAAAGCTQEAKQVAAVAYAERSLAYAPLLLAVKRRLYTEPGVSLALSHLSLAGGVGAAVASGQVLAGAMGMTDFVASVAAGAPLVVIGALTSRLDCHFVLTTARPVPVPTLPAIHLGEWRGLRVGVESGPDGTEALVRLFAAWSNGSRSAPQAAIGPFPPPRELAASHTLEGETRWLSFETDEGLAAALADRRLEAFVGRAYAAAQTLSYGSGQLGRALAEGGENHVLGALPTVLVTRRDALTASDEALLRRLVAGVGQAVGELVGPNGRGAASVALPEKDSLHLGLAHGLLSPNAASTAYAVGARLPADAVARYVELSTMAGARLDVNVGALTTTRFTG